jgi:hypothetical protein
MAMIRDHITDIANVVGKVITSTETAMSQTGNVELRDRGGPIVKKLNDCRVRLMAASKEGIAIEDPSLFKDFTNRLVPLAFDTARETKVSSA